ncbi:hypothetical protein K439DRAFT_640222 [Ramaria rubella]|nr:hypothetical protein K439DRAFT_640222 [Ramaria rubella]
MLVCELSMRNRGSLRRCRPRAATTLVGQKDSREGGGILHERVVAPQQMHQIHLIRSTSQAQVFKPRRLPQCVRPAYPPLMKYHLSSKLATTYCERIDLNLRTSEHLLAKLVRAFKFAFRYIFLNTKRKACNRVFPNSQDGWKTILTLIVRTHGMRHIS